MTGRLNSLLPESIAVYSIERVHADAHARFDATSRTYRYYITTRKNPFATETRTRVTPGLDFEAMNQAAALLLGRQDFAAFCRLHTDVKTTICNVTEAFWTVENETEAYFTITADRFLRNMVRAVVGTLFEVGRGKMTIDQFQAVIHSLSRKDSFWSKSPTLQQFLHLFKQLVHKAFEKKHYLCTQKNY